MNNLIKYFILGIALFTYSCGSPDTSDKDYSIINIADNIGKGYLLNISEIANNIEYVPLETADSSLLGDVSEVYYSNGYFVLNTKKNTSGILNIFDKDGHYYSKLNSRGRGPGEYTSIYDIDVYKDTIVLLSINKINEYSFDGKFLKTIPIDKNEVPLGVEKVKKLDDKHYLLAAGVSSKHNSKYSALIVDSFGITNLLFNYPESEIELAKNRQGLLKNLDNSMIFSNKGIGKIITGNNEFIISHNNEFKIIDTLYKINYDKYQITAKNIKNKNANSKLLFLINRVIESNNLILFNLNLNTLAHKPMKMKKSSSIEGDDILLPISCALYDKRDGSFRLIDQPADYQKGFIEDFEGGPAFWPTYISHDEYMVSFINAPEFIEHAQTHKVSDKFKKIAQGLKETDNPVLVIVKLKSE